jgi:hypothetical protein
MKWITLTLNFFDSHSQKLWQANACMTKKIYSILLLLSFCLRPSPWWEMVTNPNRAKMASICSRPRSSYCGFPKTRVTYIQ